jgi:ribose transport system permease protein
MTEIPSGAASPAPDETIPSPNRLLANLRGRSARTELIKSGTIIVLLAELIAFSLLASTFGTVENGKLLLEQAALLGIISIGLTFTLVMLDFDLSIGATATLGGVVAAKLGVDHGWLLCLLAGAGVGLLTGLVNGLIMTGFGISAFIATIGTTALITGVVQRITDNVDVTGVSSSFINLGTTEFGPFTAAVYVTAAFALFAVFFLKRTDAGRRIDAIGGNAEAARLVGISVSRYRILAFALCGLGAGVMGTLLAAQTASGSINAGTGYLLPAYTACFIGAVTRSEGQFNPLGTLVGVLILTVTENGLIQVGAESYWQEIVSGAILIAAVSISGVTQRLSNR